MKKVNDNSDVDLTIHAECHDGADHTCISIKGIYSISTLLMITHKLMNMITEADAVLNGEECPDNQYDNLDDILK